MPITSAKSDPGFWDQVLHLDYALFFKLNGQWHNQFLDTIFPFLREATFWLPLYIFLLIFILKNFGLRAWFWVLFIIITVTLTDTVSSKIIKENIYRFRPCRDPYISNYARFIVKNCGGNSSFTSSHATNHFGLATFIYLTLKPYFGKWLGLFFIWAASIAYAQVYVGVHYPLDIFAGAILGTFLGWMSASFYNRRIGLRGLE